MTNKSTLPPYVSGARPLLGHAREFLKSPDELLKRGQAEHGKMFTLSLPGQHAVVMLGPEHNKFLFAETDRRLSIRNAYKFLRRMFNDDAYFLAEHEDYLRQREIVLPRFQGRQMQDHLAIMEQEIASFLDRLPESGEFDLIDALGPVTMRIAAHCFLGSDISRRLHGFFELFRIFSDGVDPILPGWVPAPHLVRSRHARDRLRSAVNQIIQDRRAHPLDTPDFMQVLANAAYSDGDPVPDEIVISLALMLVWVGNETTPGHLAWALIDLLRHPDVMHEVLAELDQSGGDGQAALSFKQLHQMTALDRALHETERLHPGPTGIVRRAVEPIEYAGYRFPKGTILMVHPGLSHRLADVFPEPDRYRPNRFLEDPKATSMLIGFGGGFHRCLGQHFAQVETKVILTRIFQHLDLELIDRDPQTVPGQKTKWPQSPCRVRYSKKPNVAGLVKAATATERTLN